MKRGHACILYCKKNAPKDNHTPLIIIFLQQQVEDMKAPFPHKMGLAKYGLIQAPNLATGNTYLVKDIRS